MTVIWNSGDSAANITLSGGSLTATLTASGQRGVRANTSKNAGKWYWEGFVSVSTGSIWMIGWANSTASLTNFIGADKNGCGDQIQTGNIVFNGSQIANSGATSATHIVRVAFDIDALKIWFAIDHSGWNNSSTADPASGTGGASLATMNAGPYFPMFSSDGNMDAVIANFGATSTVYAIPAGFSALDTNAQAFEASAKVIAYSVSGSPANAESAAKLIGYAELPPPRNAVDAGKFIAYGALPPPRNAVDCGKLVAYALLKPTTPDMAVTISGSSDSVSASLTSVSGMAVGITQASDSIFIPLGYSVEVRIATEGGDRVSAVLDNPGSWAACTEPEQKTVWTECQHKG